jgi:hypothetical protein
MAMRPRYCLVLAGQCVIPASLRETPDPQYGTKVSFVGWVEIRNPTAARCLTIFANSTVSYSLIDRGGRCPPYLRLRFPYFRTIQYIAQIAQARR